MERAPGGGAPNIIPVGSEQRKRRRVGIGRDSGWIKWIVALAIAAYILKVWFGLSGRGSHRRPPRRPPATSVYPEQAPPLPVDASPAGDPGTGAGDYPRGVPVSQPPAPAPSKTSPAVESKASPAAGTSFNPAGSAPKKGEADEDGEKGPWPDSGVPGYGRPLPKATPYSPPGYHTKPSDAGPPQGY